MKIKLMLIALTLFSTPLISYADENAPADTKQVVANEKKPLYWVDTMEPDIHYPGPGKSRMGMDLVPVYPKEKQNSNKASSPDKE